MKFRFRPSSLSAFCSLIGSATGHHGDFSDLHGLTKGNDGWYAGLPQGWSGSAGSYGVDISTGESKRPATLSELGLLRQTIGTLTQTPDVTLTFDVSEPWNKGTILNAEILDAHLEATCQWQVRIGLRQELTAKNVPAGTTVIIAFLALKSTPGWIMYREIFGLKRKPIPAAASQKSPWRATTLGTIIRATHATQRLKVRIGPSGNW